MDSIAELDTGDHAVPQQGDACLSCMTTGVVTVAAWIGLWNLNTHFGVSWLLAQLGLVAVGGALLGRLSVYLLRRDLPAGYAGGFVLCALPVGILMLAGLHSGIDTHLEVLARNDVGWGRADLATYQYPTLGDYLFSLLSLTFGAVWFVSAGISTRNSGPTAPHRPNSL